MEGIAVLHRYFFERKKEIRRVKDLKGYVVKLPKFAKYAQILKNSVAFKETMPDRLFLMKDLAAVEEAMGLGAQKVEGEVVF